MLNVNSTPVNPAESDEEVTSEVFAPNRIPAHAALDLFITNLSAQLVDVR